MGEHIISIADNNPYSGEPLTEQEANDLRKLSRFTINQLASKKDEGLLIFPENLGKYGEEIGRNHIISFNENGMHANNIMGFVGINNTKLRIYSRFSTDEKDYFLHYMLQKVFSINIFDLKYSSANEEVFDFLMYMFPHFLKSAVKQGIFKTYQHFEYNDANVRGPINISRHIHMNIPFSGKIAYNTKEHSYDNGMTELIRHTIDYINRRPLGKEILESDNDTIDAVNKIRWATPSYQPRNLRIIIAHNMRPVNHPYFTEYRPLQQLCLRILRHEEIKYGNNKDKVYGILFDGAWLWEEYLSKVLYDEMLHLKFKDSKKHHLFREVKTGHKIQPIIPDFLSVSKKIVGDAKYMNLDNIGTLGEDDRKLKDVYYKTIMYMLRFNSERGFLFYPTKAKIESPRDFNIIDTNCHLYLLGLQIASDSIVNGMSNMGLTFRRFKGQMKKNEDDFKYLLVHPNNTK